MTDQNSALPQFSRFRQLPFGGWLARTPGSDGRALFVPTLRGAVFAMMLLVAVLPILGFYKWVERNSFRREMAAVHDSHLLIAKNLSVALSRYVTDAKAVFELAVGNMLPLGQSEQLAPALSNFHICDIVLLDADNGEISRLAGENGHADDLPRPALLAELRAIATAADGDVVISGIRSHGGTPHFFILQALAGGKMAFAPLGPAYVVALQKSIAFGERGHSMMVDQDGHVVAHPNAEWQRISKDASKLPVVQAMMRGETGVMEFYSPPMQADMIAGFTTVPETGWGVMVPQPISELTDKANQVRSAAVALALVQLALAALLSWVLATWLTRPILSIAGAAATLSRGGLDTRIGTLPKYTPLEIVQTARAFDSMGDGIEKMTAQLREALSDAERVSSERARLLEAAQRANEVKSQFVSMVSHELRTPLTSIKGALELMNSKATADLPADSQALLDIAVRNGRHLAVLIDDLLDLEKLDAGRLSYAFDEVEVGRLVQEAVEAHEGYASLAGVTVEYTPPEADITVQGDASRLQQVLANLLSNAAKFSKSGGTVAVSVVAGEECVEVRVRDHGAGIPQAAGDSIFEAFTQIDSSDKRVVGGSGLGLNIARTIIRQHGGDLRYDSVEGEGTVFVFDLPLRSGKPS